MVGSRYRAVHLGLIGRTDPREKTQSGDLRFRLATNRICLGNCQSFDEFVAGASREPPGLRPYLEPGFLSSYLLRAYWG